MNQPWHDTEEFEKLVEEVDREDAEFGGPGGSNMAEPPWVPPGPVRIPDGLPPEEVARRKKLLAELDEYMKELDEREKRAAK